MDSGCSHHTTSKINNFIENDKTYNSSVRIGNGGLLEVKGKWIVSIITPSSTKLISDSLYVLDIGKNFLSVGQMLENNYSLIFKGQNVCDIGPC